MKLLGEQPVNIENLSEEQLAAKLAPQPKEEKSKKRYVIFFHDDADGWGALGVALNGLTDPDRVFLTRPVQYGDDFSGILDMLQEDDHVYILDFSFKRALSDAISEKVQHFVVLDHHETSMKEMEGATYCTFDMTKSGVLLAYEHFFASMLSPEYESVPLPVRLLDNYDLWKKTDPYVDWSWVVGFHMYVKEYFGNYEFWRELMAMVDFDQHMFAIIRQKHEDFKVSIEELTKSAEFRIETFTAANLRGVFYPASELISLLADAVRGNKEINPDFTCSYFIKEKEDKKIVVVNLRGTPICYVRPIAEFLGGGGHNKAAGFTFEFTEDMDVMDEIVKRVKSYYDELNKHFEAHLINRDSILASMEEMNVLWHEALKRNAAKAEAERS